MDEANRKMKGQWPDSIRSLYEVLYLFQNQKIWTFYFKSAFPQISESTTVGLTPIKFPYSRTRKINLFKMLNFQRIHFSRKRPWKRATLLLDPIVNLLSQIIRFQVDAPFEDFLISDHQFFGSLKSKGRWFFMNNKSSFENILVSGVVEASFWK